jgi:hypothetical protein
MRRSPGLVCGISVGVLLLLTAATPEGGAPEILFGLPWGGDGLALNAGPEQVPAGPTAVALDSTGTMWLLDNIGQRLVAYDNTGRQVGVIPLPDGQREDLAIADDGRFALLSLHLRQVEELDASGQLCGTLAVSPLLGPLGRIGFDGQGRLEIANLHGERFVLGTPEQPLGERQSLLARRQGLPGSTIDCGIRVDRQQASLYRYPAAGPLASERGPRPEILPLQLGSVSAARLLTACSDEGMAILVERLLPGAPLQVERELVTLKNGRVTGRAPLPDDELYQGLGAVALRAGQLVRLSPTPSGLWVWRWRLP